MKDYLLKLPQELHAKVKVMAATKGISMMQFMIDAINEKINRETK